MTESLTSRKDRGLRKVSALFMRAGFRRVDVFRADQTTSEPGPLMSTANHFGGFLDAMVAMYALPRRPRIIARDVIWKIPVAKWGMNWLGAIPVHKADDPGKSSNDQMFRSCYDALRAGGHLLIFPEGITRDEPSIGRVKTGTARIVLGARSQGAAGISIVPVGVHYEDKAALRSRASIIVSAPLRVDEDIGRYVDPGDDTGPENREAVRQLTSDIETRLRQAAPDFEDWREATKLTRAAEATLRAVGDPSNTVNLAQRDRLAGFLGRKPREQRESIIESLDDYEGQLEALGISDRDVEGPGRGRFWRDLVIRVLIGLLLLPFAVLGFLIHLIPFLIVKGVGLLRMHPAGMASLKPIVAILAFGATWGLIAWRALVEGGLVWAAAALLVVPLYGVAAVVLWERVVLGARAVRTRRAMKLQGSTEEVLLESRRRLVNEVVDAL